MAKHTLLAIGIFALAALVSTTSCKKSSNSGGGSSMSATLNGTAWANSYPLVGLYVTSGGLFDIIGAQYKSGDSTALDLEFVSPITVNKPVSSDTSAFIAAYTDIKGGNETSYGVVPGGLGSMVLTITSYDSTGHKIAGTFTGVMYNMSTFADSIMVTNGKFSTSLQVQ